MEIKFYRERIRPIEFNLQDYCENDIHSIQSYLMVYDAILYLKSIKISDMDFCYRIKNGLNKYAYNLYHLITYSIDDLKRIGTIGKKSQDTIQEKLLSIGLKLDMSPVDILYSEFFERNKNNFKNLSKEYEQG